MPVCVIGLDTAKPRTRAPLGLNVVAGFPLQGESRA